MWLEFITLLVVVGLIVGIGEYYERKEAFEKAREEALQEFFDRLRYYDANYPLRDVDVTLLNAMLKHAAIKVAAFYPGFTAPTLD